MQRSANAKKGEDIDSTKKAEMEKPNPSNTALSSSSTTVPKGRRNFKENLPDVPVRDFAPGPRKRTISSDSSTTTPKADESALSEVLGAGESTTMDASSPVLATGEQQQAALTTPHPYPEFAGMSDDDSDEADSTTGTAMEPEGLGEPRTMPVSDRWVDYELDEEDSFGPVVVADKAETSPGFVGEAQVGITSERVGNDLADQFEILALKGTRAYIKAWESGERKAEGCDLRAMFNSLLSQDKEGLIKNTQKLSADSSGFGTLFDSLVNQDKEELIKRTMAIMNDEELATRVGSRFQESKYLKQLVVQLFMLLDKEKRDAVLNALN